MCNFGGDVVLFYHMSAVAYAEHNCLRNDINKPALLGVIKVVAAGRRGRAATRAAYEGRKFGMLAFALLA